MFAGAQRSAGTIADYKRETDRLVAQYVRENPQDKPGNPLLQTVNWFLNEHGRWGHSTIRYFAAALEQETGSMLEYDSFDPASNVASLLRRLKNDRPDAAGKTKKSKQVAHQQKVAAKKKRQKPRKSIPMRELRALVRYFRSQDDEFSRWIAGYIILASRLGWRPGELLILEREGNFLRAQAEKRSNQRGLTDTCEIDFSAHLGKSGLIKKASLVSELDKWIDDTRKWKAYYKGLSELQDNINSKLATACKNCTIKRTCTYTFRHFAIACLKASGFSRAEIAVIVNHATERTAGDHYGKGRQGIKRPKKIYGFDRARLLLVREKPRHFDRSSALSMKLQG